MLQYLEVALLATSKHKFEMVCLNSVFVTLNQSHVWNKVYIHHTVCMLDGVNYEGIHKSTQSIYGGHTQEIGTTHYVT